MHLKYYFIDQTGRTVMTTDKYKGAGSFSGGFATVKDKDKGAGVIDKTGKIVIGFQLQFYQISSFSEGLAAVNIRNKWGWIDKSGQVVIQPEYDWVNEMSEGVAVVSIGDEVFIIDRNGEKIFSQSRSGLRLNIYENARFSEGLIPALDTKTSKWGFIDKTSNFIIGPKFDDACNFSEGLARVMMVKDGEEMVGFIDHSGKFITPPIFNSDVEFRRNSDDFSEGLASLTENLRPTITEPEKYVYINKQGEIVLSTNFFYARPFHEGMAVVYDSEKNKWGYIDKTGKIVIQLQYDAAQDFSEGVALVGVRQ